MLKNSIFHKPVIPCDTLSRLALCLTSNVFTQFYLLWVLFLIVLEKSYIFQKLHIFDFGWLFTALQFGKCTECLYKMNTNSI